MIFKETEVEKAIQLSLLEAVNEIGSLTNDNREDILARGYEIVCSYSFKKMLKRPRPVVINETVEEDGEVVTVRKCKTVTEESVLFPAFFKNNAYTPYKRLADFSKLPVACPFVHKPDRNKFIKNAKLLFANVDAYNAGACLTNYRKIIQNVYFNLGYPGLKPQQVCFYQYSALGGTGKSNFLNRLKHFAETYNIPVADVNPTNQRWIGSEYSSNIIGVVNEFFPPRSRLEGEDKIRTLNNIIDNEEYQVEYKGETPYFSHSRVSLFINSNKMPFDSNIRRYAVVRYNEKPFARIAEEDREKYFKDRTPEEWDEIILSTFESCPFDETFEDLECKNSDDLNELIHAANDVIDNLHRLDDSFCPQSATIREFAKTYLALIAPDHIPSPEAVKKQVSFWTNDILKAVAEGVIKPSQRVNGNLRYSRYNIQEIADLPTPETEIPNSLNDIDNMFERTSVAFDSFLDPEQTMTSDDVPTYGLEDLVESASTSDAVTTDYDPSSEFIAVAKFANHRRDKEHAVPTALVYESDSVSLEEQMEMMKKHKSDDRVMSATYSGSKSIHYIVPIDPECLMKIDNAEDRSKFYKFCWKQIGEEIFTDVSEFDKACASIGRLTRNPGATRSSNGKIQTSYYNKRTRLNKLEKYYSQWMAERRFEEMKRELAKRSTPGERGVRYLQNVYNKTRNEHAKMALDALDGKAIVSGSNMIGCLGYLKTSGVEQSVIDQVKAEFHRQHPSNIHR